MKSKYFNDAFIGNDNIVASYSKKGELLRLFYPAPDYREFIEFFHTGVKINDSSIIYLHDDINNEYKQYYTEDTNILNTEILNKYFKLEIKQTDFAMIKQNIIVKRYTVTNKNKIDLEVKFLLHSSLITSLNNMVGGTVINNCLLQYNHENTIAIFSKNNIDSHQINNTKENFLSGNIKDKDYIGMSSDSSISYNLGIFKPNETKQIDILLYVRDNNEKYIVEKEDIIEEFKKLNIDKEYNIAKRYWNKYINIHNVIEMKNLVTEMDKKIEKIYKRSILLFPLLTNKKTGGISAALEIDEENEKCGRYSYCWTRDAVFITKAMDILKMQKEVEKFYKVFCKETQRKNGMWEQRFYTDCRLAPCWGYQIDETASVIHGVYEHYLQTKEIKFIKENLKMLEKATKFLKNYITEILENKIPKYISYDIWEMNEGVHLYSIASIFSAFIGMIEIYSIVEKEYENNRLKIENIIKERNLLRKYLEKIKEYIINNFYDTEKRTFVRNLTDKKMDISILGLVEPFNVFIPKEKRILNTIEKINLTLRTYTGGYIRFEQDSYIGGNNPWPIATLWIALYYIQIKDYKKAMECFKFVVNTATEHGFLSEQVDNKTMQPAWVIGLGWSHAMFIIVLKKLLKK